MDKERVTKLLLRLSLVSVFSYAAISSFLTPENWIGYFPAFLRSLIPSNIILPLFSLYELALSFWILSGSKLKYSSALAGLTLLGIITFNYNQLDILFRDFAIILVAAALFVSEI